jgi:SOS response associated peptidase (SRAP)
LPDDVLDAPAFGRGDHEPCGLLPVGQGGFIPIEVHGIAPAVGKHAKRIAASHHDRPGKLASPVFSLTRPLAVFAGIWTNWTSVRKVKEGMTTNDLFGFLTTEPNDVVAPIHAKAMPVILMTPTEIETWMTAPAEEALKLQRPLPDGGLAIVARGERKYETVELA